uniref:Uncharacterized protein n=1 Tax=Avena sativa TaxID=4498 RepID=A0ACD5V7N1_AVESA
MWKSILDTAKKVASAAPKLAPAAPELATRKRPSGTRRRDVSPATKVTPAALLRLEQAAVSKKTTLPSALPHALANDGEDEDNSRDFTKEILSILNGPADAEESGGMEAVLEESEDAEDVISNKILEMEWFAGSHPSNTTTQYRKEVAREKKKRYIFKNTESRRFTRLMRMCADKLGTESALEFFGRLGRETGIKEFNALIRVCLDKARACGDIDSAVEHIFRAYRLLEMMKDRGFQIEEDSYGPFLLYLVDVELLEEFEMFSAFFKEANPRSDSRIAYYEMLLLIRAQDEENIQELCRSVEDCNEEAHYGMAESYMLAFAESNRKMDFVRFLELLDPRKLSGSKYISSVFKYMGRFELENCAEKLLREMMSKVCADGNVSSLTFDYAANIPNIVAEDVIATFNKWQEKFELAPSVGAYDRIISFCCSSSKISLALDVAECLCKSNPNVPIELLNPIIQACEQSYELHMVRPLYDLMSRHKLKLKNETFRSMIALSVKLKDFDGAYNILSDAEESGETSTVTLYNIIMAGYFREKNHNGAERVIAEMQSAGVKPDSETFSYLILNCDSEEKVSKYLDELQQDGIQMTKHAYMALINAYSRLGNFDMAKQVFCQIWEMEPVNLDVGMELLRAVKELGLNVSRTSLDFLLSTCVKAKDSRRAQQIWEEYESSGLPHNVLTSFRMCQALFSSGQWRAARKLLRTIPKDDLHVRYLIDSCRMTYGRQGGKRSAVIRPSPEKTTTDKV